jgi:hypothetical protein
MSPRTPALPPNDRAMWRRVVARTHPDAGGDHELFIWTCATRDVICGGELGSEIPRRERQDQPSRWRESSTSSADRVPFDPFADFGVLTHRAVTMATAVAQPYGYLLRLLSGCYPVAEGALHNQQSRGASYKSLAAIGHAVGMSKGERVHWYRVAESVPLSQRHAGHILSRLQREAA